MHVTQAKVIDVKGYYGLLRLSSILSPEFYYIYCLNLLSKYNKSLHLNALMDLDLEGDDHEIAQEYSSNFIEIDGMGKKQGQE